MADVSLQLVREFFELNLFHVLTNWQQDPWSPRAAEQSAQLFVENARPLITREPGFALPAEDLALLERAVVEIRAWHGDRFYPSVIEANPALFQFVGPEALSLAREVFNGRPFSAVLVISELPASPEQRRRAIDLLRRAGVQHVIEFPTILQELLQKVSADIHYAGSPTLQTLRLVKRYRLARDQQMELPFAMEPPTPSVPPRVEAVEASPAPEEDEQE